MRKLKRTKYDAQAPIVKQCRVSAREVWNARREGTVSHDLSRCIIKAPATTRADA